MSQTDKKVKKTSLIQKIMLAFLLPITAGILITMLILFFSMEKDKIEQVKTLTSLMNINMLDRIDRFKSEVELLAEIPAVTSLDYAEAEPFLNKFMAASPGVWSHFLITDKTGFNVAHTDGQKSRGVSIADRTYFTIPWKEGKTEVADPTFSKSTGRRILAIGTPIYENGTKVGVLVGFVRLEYISQILNEFKLTKSSFSFMINDKGLINAHPNQDIVLVQNWLKPDSADEASIKYIEAMSAGFKKILTDITEGKSGIAMATVDKKLSLVCYSRTGIGKLSIVSVSPASEVFAIIIVLGVSLIFIFIILVIISFIFGKSIVRPILKITEALPAIAEGDFTLNLNVSGTDESAQLAEYFNQTIAKIRESLLAVKTESALMQETGAHLAENASQTASAVHEISANIDNIKQQVVNESAGVTQTQATIEQIVKNIEKLDRDIEKQSESIADSTAATEEMVANIRSVFDILSRNTGEVVKLGSAAQQGRESLSQSTGITEKIASESDGLLEASSIIENIASQTNLLAMNAAIEAAHAGDAGKGFAVVADEIRKLAEDSSSQSKSITLVLKKLKNDIENLMQSANYVQQQFTSIFDLTQNVQNQGQTVNNMMQEQAEANEQVLKSMLQISEITGGVKQGSTQMLQGSREISIEMQKLAEITDMINGSMNEMTAGTSEITKATQNVNKVSRQANESIDKVLQTVNVFKV